MVHVLLLNLKVVVVGAVQPLPLLQNKASSCSNAKVMISVNSIERQTPTSKLYNSSFAHSTLSPTNHSLQASFLQVSPTPTSNNLTTVSTTSPILCAYTSFPLPSRSHPPYPYFSTQNSPRHRTLQRQQRRRRHRTIRRLLSQRNVESRKWRSRRLAYVFALANSRVYLFVDTCVSRAWVGTGEVAG